jgi:hypothetical protein
VQVGLTTKVLTWSSAPCWRRVALPRILVQCTQRLTPSALCSLLRGLIHVDLSPVKTRCYKWPVLRMWLCKVEGHMLLFDSNQGLKRKR